MKLKILTIAGAALSLIATAQAQTISLQFWNSSDTGANLQPTDVTGVSAVDNWNVITMPAAAPSWTGSGFVDNSAASVGLSYTLGGSTGNVQPNTWNQGNVNPTANLLNSWADVAGITAPTLSLSGITYGTYDLYIYFAPYAAGDTVSYTIGGNTQSLSPSGSGQTFFTQGLNYVEFTGLTGSSLSVAMSHTAQFNPLGLAGLQIVDAAPVPEPATLGLASLGGLMLLVFRHRRAA